MDKILILVGGGIGDQVCAEPTIRYAVNQFPELEISVLTEHPEFFTHIKGVKDVFKASENPDLDLSSYIVRGTYPGDKDDLGKVLCSVHTNGVQYCAMMALKWDIPLASREILIHGEAPVSEIDGLPVLATNLHRNVVVVHPGQSWKSKTFAPEWWEETVRHLSQLGALPVIVGASHGPTGTVGNFPNYTFDLRDKLTLLETTWLLQRAQVILTNDSAPLHLAASSDPVEYENTGLAWIGMLATAKHPDFLMHYRHGVMGYKMVNLTSGGLWSRIGLSSDAKGATKEEIENWLPTPFEAAKWAVGKIWV